MYRYDPNFGTVDPYTPAAKTPGAKAIAHSGLACGWLQQSSKITIDLAVAHPTVSGLATLKTAASTGSAGAPGQYFSVKNGTGELQQFVGPYWVSLSSIAFASAADAQPLMGTVTAALG